MKSDIFFIFCVCLIRCAESDSGLAISIRLSFFLAAMFSTALRQNTIGLPLGVCAHWPAVIYPRPAVEKPFFACFTAGACCFGRHSNGSAHTQSETDQEWSNFCSTSFHYFRLFSSSTHSSGVGPNGWKKRTKHAPPPDRPSRLLRAGVGGCFGCLFHWPTPWINDFNAKFVFNVAVRVQSCASTRFVAALAILPRWKANIITHEHQREREKSKTNFSCNKLETQICITALDAFYAAHLQPHSPPLSSPSPPSLHPPLPTAQHSSINLWPYFYALHTLTGCCFSGEFSFQPAVHTKDCLCFARFA